MMGIEIENLASVRRAYNEGESIFARGLWKGTSRSLGAFRRDFFKDSPVIRRGITKSQARNSPTANQMPALARQFRFEVNPPKPANIKQATGTHATKSANVNGNFHTRSEAAESLEKGGTITPKGKWLGIPIVSSPTAINAQKVRKGEAKARAKPSWRKLDRILKKRKYVTTFERKGNRMIVFVRDRKNENAKPIPVMVLVQRIQMRPVLNLFDLWKAYTPEILVRFDKEMKAAVQDTYRRMRK